MKTPDLPHEPLEVGQDEQELCISCLQANTPGVHFCVHCGTPLTAYASTAPLESCFAQGDFLRKAATQGRWGGWIRAGVFVLLAYLLFALISGLVSPW